MESQPIFGGCSFTIGRSFEYVVNNPSHKDGNPGSGNIDSATGEVMTTTEQQATALGIAVVTGSDGITRNAATGQPI